MRTLLRRSLHNQPDCVNRQLPTTRAGSDESRRSPQSVRTAVRKERDRRCAHGKLNDWNDGYKERVGLGRLRTLAVKPDFAPRARIAVSRQLAFAGQLAGPLLPVASQATVVRERSYIRGLCVRPFRAHVNHLGLATSKKERSRKPLGGQRQDAQEERQ